MSSEDKVLKTLSNCLLLMQGSCQVRMKRRLLSIKAVLLNSMSRALLPRLQNVNGLSCILSRSPYRNCEGLLRSLGIIEGTGLFPILHRENVPSAKLPQMRMSSRGNVPNFSLTPIWPGYPQLGCYQYHQPIVLGSLWWRLSSITIN